MRVVFVIHFIYATTVWVYFRLVSIIELGEVVGRVGGGGKLALIKFLENSYKFLQDGNRGI